MIKKALPGEFLHEAENTRKLLKMVPDSALSYHPQPQLWPVAKLASHIAEIYNWYSGIFNVDEFDFATYKYDNGDITKAANIVEKMVWIFSTKVQSRKSYCKEQALQAEFCSCIQTVLAAFFLCKLNALLIFYEVKQIR